MTPRRKQVKITSPTLHATILLMISVFLGILIMSFVFRVEVVSRGQGRVLPVGRVQVVQPEFSGRIIAIRVRNGDRVAGNDVLVELDPTDDLAELGAIVAERDRLRIEAARIETFIPVLTRNFSAPGFIGSVLEEFSIPKGLDDGIFYREQKDLLGAELLDLDIAQKQIDARKETNRKSEEVTRADIARIEAALSVQTERLNMARRLFNHKTISRSAFLDTLQSFTELERKRNVYLRELDQKTAQRIALGVERRRLITTKRSALLDRRTRINARLATLAEKARAAEHRVASKTLRAPTSGAVNQLRVFTIGGRVEAGAELMRIVPAGATIEVEAVFSNQDIGFMAEGQQANIRFDAYPSERFGFVVGNVSDLSADSIELPDGQWGYVAWITPQTTVLEAGGVVHALKPGMTATVDVITDKRRLIGYFFAPILRTIENAMGER